MRFLLTAVLALLVSQPSGALRLPERLEFSGNTVLTDEVYLAVLERTPLPRTQSLEVLRKHVAKSLERFLADSGYALATVRCEPAGNRLRVTVDEGHLDRIIFVGEGAITALRLKIALDLPGEVFNEPLLERRLNRLAEVFELEGYRYRVVPVAQVDHSGPQLEDPGFIQGLPLIQPGRPHALHIHLLRKTKPRGLKLRLGVQPPDGVSVGALFHANDLVVPESRLELDSLAGVRASSIGIRGNRVGLSRLAGETRIFSPPFLEALAPFASLRADLWTRRRQDLGADNYFLAVLSAGIHFELQLFDLLQFRLGGGIEHRRLFGMVPIEGEVLNIERTSERSIRPFAHGILSFNFGRDRLRLDRNHKLELHVRVVGRDRTLGRIWDTGVRYENTVLIGWDEFRYVFRSTYLVGDVPFYNEVAVGDGFLRAAFLADYFFRKGSVARLEYRVSLSRDLIKISVFNDAMVFRELNLAREPVATRFADNLGIGLHFLIADLFQLDLYTGVGLTSDRKLDVGVSLDLKQAF